MKKRYAHFFYFLILWLFLLVTSCEKDFIPNQPSGAKKMVVNCLLDNQQTVKVFVTESSSPSSDSQLAPITDALVEFYKNDSLLQILPFVFTDTAQTFGCYTYSYYPEPGNKYSVKITDAKYGTVTGEDWLPEIPAVNTLQLVSYGTGDNFYESKFRLQFQDNGAKENFYRLNTWVWGQRYFVTPPSDTTVKDYGFTGHPKLYTQLSDTVRDFGTWLLFADKSFNGQNKEIIFSINTLDTNRVITENATFQFCEVSRAHFEYYRTLEQYQHGNHDQAKVYSNISNGYGIFMAQAVNTITIPLK